jgi:hypothetical protein
MTQSHDPNLETFRFSKYYFWADNGHIYEEHFKLAEALLGYPITKINPGGPRKTKANPITPRKSKANPSNLYINPGASPFNFNPDKHIGLHLGNVGPNFKIPLVTKDTQVAKGY